MPRLPQIAALHLAYDLRGCHWGSLHNEYNFDLHRAFLVRVLRPPDIHHAHRLYFLPDGRRLKLQKSR